MSKAEEGKIRNRIAKILEKHRTGPPVAPDPQESRLWFESPKVGAIAGFVGLALAVVSLRYEMMDPSHSPYVGFILSNCAVAFALVAIWIGVPWPKPIESKTIGAIVILLAFACFDYSWEIRSYHGPFCYALLGRDTGEVGESLRLALVATPHSIASVQIAIFKGPDTAMEGRSLEELERKIGMRSIYAPMVYEEPTITGITVDWGDAEYQVNISTPYGLFSENITMVMNPFRETIDVITHFGGRAVYHYTLEDRPKKSVRTLH